MLDREAARSGHHAEHADEDDTRLAFGAWTVGATADRETSIRCRSNDSRQDRRAPRIRRMINLNHTHTIVRSDVDSDPAGRTCPTHPDLGVHAAENPYLSLHGEARWYGNSLWEFLIPADVTNGNLSVFEATMPEGFGPPRHIHTREDEVFVVLEGEAWFDIDGQRHLAGPGTSVYVPRGVLHTFRVKSPVARMLGIMTPGRFEQLFRNLSVPAAERTLPPPGAAPFDVAAVMAEQHQLGTQVVGPPMAAENA
jgi:quercetin dioxygenase-like cupin family protein